MSSQSSCPSCPYRPHPTVNTSPADETNALCLAPAASPTILTSCPADTVGTSIGSGSLRAPFMVLSHWSVDVLPSVLYSPPRPSCPVRLSPHANTVPPALSANECLSPAATATTSRGASQPCAWPYLFHPKHRTPRRFCLSSSRTISSSVGSSASFFSFLSGGHALVVTMCAHPPCATPGTMFLAISRSPPLSSSSMFGWSK
mmetsp:Transcript_3223/g.14595  ORF Transcript_3223/g.14595 Transcript_3223/m.14595 type:complete len:202 (-) Transcript_3223:294-899(-)